MMCNTFVIRRKAKKKWYTICLVGWMFNMKWKLRSRRQVIASQWEICLSDITHHRTERAVISGPERNYTQQQQQKKWTSNKWRRKFMHSNYVCVGLGWAGLGWARAMSIVGIFRYFREQRVKVNGAQYRIKYSDLIYSSWHKREVMPLSYRPKNPEKPLQIPVMNGDGFMNKPRKKIVDRNVVKEHTKKNSYLMIGTYLDEFILWMFRSFRHFRWISSIIHEVQFVVWLESLWREGERQRTERWKRMNQMSHVKSKFTYVNV